MRPLVFASLHCSVRRDNVRLLEEACLGRGVEPPLPVHWWNTVGHCLGGVGQRLHSRARRHAAARERDRDHVQI